MRRYTNKYIDADDGRSSHKQRVNMLVKLAKLSGARMTKFQNNPLFRSVNGVEQKGRYVHQPLTIEHYGIHAAIRENGTVLITGIPEKDPDTEEMDFEEVEIPASLVFKLANLLKDTRTIVFQQATPEVVVNKV